MNQLVKQKSAVNGVWATTQSENVIAAISGWLGRLLKPAASNIGLEVWISDSLSPENDQACAIEQRSREKGSHRRSLCCGQGNGALEVRFSLIGIYWATSIDTWSIIADGRIGKAIGIFRRRVHLREVYVASYIAALWQVNNQTKRACLVPERSYSRPPLPVATEPISSVPIFTARAPSRLLFAQASCPWSPAPVCR